MLVGSSFDRRPICESARHRVPAPRASGASNATSPRPPCQMNLTCSASGTRSPRHSSLGGHMQGILLVWVTAIWVTACAGSRSVRSYVQRLRNDTLAVQTFTRQADGISGQVLRRVPQTQVQTYSATLNADGSVGSIDVSSTTPSETVDGESLLGVSVSLPLGYGRLNPSARRRDRYDALCHTARHRSHGRAVATHCPRSSRSRWPVDSVRVGQHRVPCT